MERQVSVCTDSTSSFKSHSGGLKGCAGNTVCEIKQQIKQIQQLQPAWQWLWRAGESASQFNNINMANSLGRMTQDSLTFTKTYTFTFLNEKIQKILQKWIKTFPERPDDMHVTAALNISVQKYGYIFKAVQKKRYICHMPENQSKNADIYGIYQSKRTPASDKHKCSV